MFFLMKGLFRKGGCFGSALAATPSALKAGEKGKWWFMLTAYSFLNFINLCFYSGLSLNHRILTELKETFF